MSLNDTFKALADPTRREILKMLNDKSLSAGDIAKAFNISKPSMSHHLNILKNAELVLAERDGQNIIYSLNASVLQEVVQQFMEFFDIGEEDTNETE
jgi:ArsR family transcriptional regulator, arsenate/arsenite/antimonite-responsive transcriptional repressor